MDYAIIRMGGKQYRVREGETLLVDRVKADEGKTFNPDVLLGDAKVTAKIIAHERGPKIRIGKYKKRTGYKRHTGFRAATSRIAISLGGSERATSDGAKDTESPTETATAAVAPAPAETATVASAPPPVERPEALPTAYE